MARLVIEFVPIRIRLRFRTLCGPTVTSLITWSMSTPFAPISLASMSDSEALRLTTLKGVSLNLWVPLYGARGVRLAMTVLMALLTIFRWTVLVLLLACSGGPIPSEAPQALLRLPLARNTRRGAVL